MADNPTLPLTGNGDSTLIVATDDTGPTGQVQVVKLAVSTNGSATLIPADPTNGLTVNNTGTFAVQSTPATATTATLSNIASSATSVTILSSNASRKQAMVFNDSTQTLYLKLGATASSTSYTVKMVAGSYYELPPPVYTGVIDGIWASANGSARVTEL